MSSSKGYSSLDASSPRLAAVLAQLVAASEAEVIELLIELAEKKPGILNKAVSTLRSEDYTPPPGVGRAVKSTNSRELEIRDGPSRTPPPVVTVALGEAHPVGVTEHSPLVQFTTFIYYCDEDEGHMSIDVMRAGDLSQSSAVTLKTRDLSAKADRHYTAVSCRIEFAPMEGEKSVTIDLIDMEEWDSTTEFAVELSGGEQGVLNCKLGRYLWCTRVKIIDGDCFPSNKYREFIHHGKNVNKAPDFGLFWEWVKLNWGNPVVRERTIKCAIIDQMHNLYDFFHLFVNVYLVDYVLNPESSTDRLVLVKTKDMSLLLIVAVTVLPFMILHWIDDRKANKYGVGGTSRARLQICLLRKFLNYDTFSRMRMRNGDLIMAMTRDTTMLVGSGYGNVIDILKEVGKLCFMLSYFVVAPYVFNKPFSPIGFIPLGVIPICMSVFLHCRNVKTKQKLETRSNAQNAMVHGVDETVGSYRLIADYNKRELFIERFEKLVKGYNSTNREAGVILNNNAYFAKYLSILAIVSWTFVGGLMVIEGHKTLGMFLAAIRIFGNIAGAWGGIYEHFLEILTVFPACENITVAMNLPTDVPIRKALNRQRRKNTTTMRAQIRANKAKDETRMAIDMIPITLVNLPFTYNTTSPPALKGEPGAQRETKLNNSGEMKIDQGDCVFLMGPSGGGKSTLLKILGAEILPDPDILEKGADGCQMFVPAHLRVLHVSMPMFFDGTLLENLTFGVVPNDDDAAPARVLGVCKRLGVSAEVLKLLDDQGNHDWPDIFSTTQCQLLSLARALVANPEVLCIHQPTQLFDELFARELTLCLKEFVEKRGIVQALPPSNRRPRTLVMTTAHKGNFDVANRVFHISQDKGIRLVPPSQYDTIEMF